MNYKQKANEFRELLDSFKRVSIVSHIYPDGDTIGSALALYNSLKLEGKQVEVCCVSSDLPLNLNFLNGFDKYKNRIDYNDSLIITVDCGDISRVKFNLDGREIVNIDHHKSNTNFGKLNVVEIEVSTTAVLYKLLREGFAIDKNVATALYAGLLTDSQRYSTSLVTKETFKIASELLEYGLDPSYIATMLFKRKPLSHTRLIAKAINSLQLYFNASVAIMVLDKDSFIETGATQSDVTGIIDYAISLITVEIAILISDFENSIKVSIRSKNEDISKIASAFGGGGHKNAAGFEVKNSKISKIKDDLINYIKENYEKSKS